MCFVAMFPEIFKYAKHPYFAISGIVYSTVLGPLFFNLWVHVGSGNANFFYGVTLVFALSQVILLYDLMHAFTRREWERLNPGWRKMNVETFCE
jgi:phosphatidylinositol glycan class U